MYLQGRPKEMKNIESFQGKISIPRRFIQMEWSESEALSVVG